jgi:hypothetical protein
VSEPDLRDTARGQFGQCHLQECQTQVVRVGNQHGVTLMTCDADGALEFGGDGQRVQLIVQKYVAAQGRDTGFFGDVARHRVGGGATVQKEQAARMNFGHQRNHCTALCGKQTAGVVVDPNGVRNLGKCAGEMTTQIRL